MIRKMSSSSWIVSIFFRASLSLDFLDIYKQDGHVKPGYIKALNNMKKRIDPILLKVPNKTLKYLSFLPCLEMVVNMDVETFLSEDIETVDITSEALLRDEVSHAQIIAKEDCVMAGLEEAKAIFSFLDLDVKTPFSDGEKVMKGQTVLTLSGRTKDILAGERLALNFFTLPDFDTWTNM